VVLNRGSIPNFTRATGKSQKNGGPWKLLMCHENLTSKIKLLIYKKIKMPNGQ
jgi:hypothetical protein